MTEDRAPYAVPPPQPQTCDNEGGDRVLWLAVRQGLLLIVVAIEKKYGLRSSRSEDRAA